MGWLSKVLISLMLIYLKLNFQGLPMLEMINSLILARNLLKTRSFHQLSTFMLPLKHRKVCVCSSPCLPTKTTRWIRGPNQTRFLCGDGESHIPGNSTNLTLFLDVELILYQYFIILKGYNLKLFEMIFLLKLYICMYTYIYIHLIFKFIWPFNSFFFSIPPKVWGFLWKFFIGYLGKLQ